MRLRVEKVDALGWNKSYIHFLKRQLISSRRGKITETPFEGVAVTGWEGKRGRGGFGFFSPSPLWFRRAFCCCFCFRVFFQKSATNVRRNENGRRSGVGCGVDYSIIDYILSGFVWFRLLCLFILV